VKKGLAARWLAPLLLLALASPAGAQAREPRLGPPPYEGDCLGFTEPRGCFQSVRLTEFELDRHIYRVGDTVVGTGSTAWRESTMWKAGAGLRSKGCRGKPYPGPVTCRWKAVSATNKWTWANIGIYITVPGSAPYLDGTFYAVVGDEPSIEGLVRTPDGRPVDNVTVKLKGPETYTARTDEKGYYYKFVKRGRYRVSPVRPRVRSSPPARTVTAKRDRSVEANFKLCPPDTDCPKFKIVDSELGIYEPRYEEAPVYFAYKGSGWDPEGGPIQVSWSGAPASPERFPPFMGWDGQQTRSFPAAEKFEADFVGELWPERSSIRDRGAKTCRGTLTASQDEVVFTKEKERKATGFVIYSERSPLAIDDVFCRGELRVDEEEQSSRLPGLIVAYSHPVISAFDDGRYLTGGTVGADRDPGDIDRRVMCLEGVSGKRLQVFMRNTDEDGNIREGEIEFRVKLDNGTCRRGRR
jgi:hypothetical protein